MGNLSGFGGHLGNDLGEFEEIGVRLYKKQLAGSAGFKISTGWFEEFDNADRRVWGSLFRAVR